MVRGSESSTDAQWSYCINPYCQARLNPRGNRTCQGCGTDLEIAGRYRLLEPLRPLNPGYVTEIFAVEDTQDPRPKVLKVLTRPHSKLIELFQREAEVLHRLDNPGIPKVDSRGCFTIHVRDRPKPLYCLVMERVEGDDLQQWLTHHGAVDQTLALVWLQQLAEILDQIHRNHLFHRDIKPSNIMLRPEGAWGQLVLIDFGTAREITETVVRGQDSTVVYSDGYTAPEQIRGRATPQSDFFALGRTFIHLLTNQHPNEFPEEAETQNLRWRDHAPHIAPYFADLISRLAADASRDRPRDSQDLLQQLEKVRLALFPRPLFPASGAAALPDQTILPRGEEWITHLDGNGDERRTVLQEVTELEQRDRPSRLPWFQRYPSSIMRALKRRSGRRILLAILLLILLLLNGILIVSRRNFYLRQQIILTQSLLSQAANLQGPGGTQLNESLLLGVEAWRRLQALGLPTLPADQILQTGLSLLPRTALRIEHQGDVNRAVFSPDGTYVATAGADHTAQLWNSQTQEWMATVEHGGSVQAIAFSPDGTWLATGSTDQTLKLTPIANPDAPRTLELPTAVQAIAFSPDGTQLVSASGNQVWLWQVETGALVRQFSHPGFVMDLAFSPAGERLAIAGNEGTVSVHALNNPDAPPRQLAHPSSVHTLAFSPTGDRLLTGSQDRRARLWAIDQEAVVHQLEHDRGVVAVDVSPDGTHLATATGSPLPFLQTHNVHLWDAETGQSRFQSSHGAGITDLTFSADGERLASSSFDRTATVWDVANGRAIAQMTHQDAVVSVAFHPQGRSLLTASLDKTAQVWEMVGNPVLLTLEHPASVQQFDFSADGSQLVSSSADQTLRLWDTQTGEVLQEFTAADAVGAIAFSPQGQVIATVQAERAVQFWNANTGSPTGRISHPERINAIAFHPEGRYLATASVDNTARVWETSSGLELARVEHESFVEDVTFSRDGRYLATAGLDNTARLWEWQGTRPREVAQFSHDSFVSAVAFSQDGRYLATASLDNTVKLWDLGSPNYPEVARLQHSNDVMAIAFSPDDRYLVTTSTTELSPAGAEGNVVQVWSVPRGRVLLQWVDPASIATAGFTADSDFLATVSPSQGVQIWAVPEGEVVARLNQNPALQRIALGAAGEMLAANSGQNLLVWTWQNQDLVQQTCDRLPQDLTPEAWQRYLGSEPYRLTCGDR
jgi:WD40 repeat protein/serine/threonine protein kinase